MTAREDDHRLDKELLPIMLDQRVRNAMRPGLTTIDPVLMRARAAAEFVPWNDTPEEMAKVSDFTIDAKTHEIPVRLYEPTNGGFGGALVYFHGGGWVIGDLDLEDGALRLIAKHSGLKVLSVDYRLAPEHMFPAALEDGETVMHWLRANGDKIGIDVTKVAFGGGSAGANVALGTALRLRDNGGPTPIYMVLLYGAFSRGQDYPSYGEFGDGRFGLPSVAMDFFWQSYLGDSNDHPHAIPINADLKGLPDCYILETELDVLAAENSDMVNKMRVAGLEVNHKIYKGAIHGFTQYFKSSELARSALKEIGQILASKIGDK